MRPETYLFTEDHEWVSISDGIASVGITDYAGSELGDVVYVDLPEVGKKVSKGESMFTVESVKAVSDIYAPLSGEITEINQTLKDKPELVNEDPFKGAWMVKIKLTDQGESTSLLGQSAYNDLIASLTK